MQYLRREEGPGPTSSTQTNGTPPADVASPDSNMGARQPIPPPMPPAEPVVRILHAIPPAISVGYGGAYI